MGFSSRSFRSLVNPNLTYAVSERAKIVDATYMGVVVPSRSHPAEAGRYEVADDAELIPINDVVKVGLGHNQYVVVGAGKTGIDAVLWLLRQGMDPERIAWVMPRDAWVLTREAFQFMQNPWEYARMQFDFSKGLASAKSVEEAYLISEKCKALQRLDPSVWPTRNKCATVNSEEMELLRSVKNIIRNGRLKRIEKDKLLFASGAVVPTGNSTLYVDCTADGLAARPSVPVFQGDVIKLQAVAMCQQVFSAAVIGHLEGRGGTDDAKNALTKPVPHPDTAEDFFTALASGVRNKLAWKADPDMNRWLASARLYDETSTWKYANKMKFLFWALGNIRDVMFLNKLEEDMMTNIEKIMSTSKL